MDQATFWNKKHYDYLSTDWIDKPTLFALMAKSYLPKAGKLLDLGSGQGQDSRYFAKLGYDVTSADFSDDALALNRQKTKAAGLKMHIQSIDLSQPLPFTDNCFDIVYAHLSIHYFNHQTTQNLFAQLKRILKPNGLLALLTNSTADPELLEGRQLETDFVEIQGVHKRFFDPLSITRYAKGFETIVADQEGKTYKDPIRLVRYIGRKP